MVIMPPRPSTDEEFHQKLEALLNSSDPKSDARSTWDFVREVLQKCGVAESLHVAGMEMVEKAIANNYDYEVQRRCYRIGVMAQLLSFSDGLPAHPSFLPSGFDVRTAIEDLESISEGLLSSGAKIPRILY